METYEQERRKAAREYVARGAAWLDENQPDWLERITQPISMWSTELCVAGQALAHRVDDDLQCGYDVAFKLLETDRHEDVTCYGFVEIYDTVVFDAWTALIAERRAAAAVAS